MAKPHFIIKNKFQKRSELYEDILTRNILRDVCRRITGRTDYTVEFDNEGYNKGRLATLEYRGRINYISFSEFEIASRNSFFQSFPSALVKYHQETNSNKRIYFYFLTPDGNIETSYFIFMYRLMKTAGTEFLNEDELLENEIVQQRSSIPPRIKINQMPLQEKYNKLKTESKQLMNIIKMICYRAETAVANILTEYLKGTADEKRMLVKQIVKSHADIIPDYENKTLTVLLHCLSAPRFNHAADKLAELLNQTETIFPGSDLKLIFKTNADSFCAR